MNKALLIQITVLMPLMVAATIFFALGWWIHAVIALVAAVAAFFWIRRAVVNRTLDDVIAANAGSDDPQPRGTGDEPRGSRPEPGPKGDHKES